MALFTTLLMLISERLFKLGEYWQFNHHLGTFSRRVKHFSFGHVLYITTITTGVTFLLLRALRGVLFDVPTLPVRLLIDLLCTGAGKVRLHYHAYLTAIPRNDSHTHATIAGGLTMIHGVPAGRGEREYLCKLRNALLWINFRFYLAPLFWLVVGGAWGPVTLMGYAFLHAWQYWLARHQTPHHHLQPGISVVLRILDQVSIRFADVVYALIGYGKEALPAWLASLGNLHTSQYQVLTHSTQSSLAREPHVDKVETPRATALMAKKISLVVVVVIALLTIYGALM